jgi:hypothetical protein
MITSDHARNLMYDTATDEDLEVLKRLSDVVEEQAKLGNDHAEYSGVVPYIVIHWMRSILKYMVHVEEGFEDETVRIAIYW